MQFFLIMPSGMTNSVDPNKTALKDFARNFGIQNFRTLTVFFSEKKGLTFHLNNLLGKNLKFPLLLQQF